ncbi:MAG TPA: cache domain-containing protein [Smithellaceae bacterium]|nr:cache domain-containing protein [Smithellaceae bacterium]HRS88603.1 cache domain-containing protein [Smithellaceae bacterium]HRV25883.1 cache domain-containing protein [Smithellaceae bacterium]
MKIKKIFSPTTLRFDLQSRLAIGFLVATCLTGVFATLVSLWTINRNTIAEVQNRVRQDINTAKLIYNNKIEQIKAVIQFTAEGSDLQDLISSDDFYGMGYIKARMRKSVDHKTENNHAILDMLTLVDAKGRVLYRAGNPKLVGDSLLHDALVKRCIQKKEPVASTELMSLKDIVRENPALAKRATIDIIKTPLSAEIDKKQLTEGMVMKAAYPVIDRNNNMLLGVLVGGVLINQDNEIVDRIKQTVYHGEKYKGREMGVATIFQGGIRISTNVMTEENKRAIGTILSKEVYNRVIVEEKDWAGRAFVVNDWYITTYTPIFNLNRKIIGVLYTGILEAKYRDIMWEMIWINLGITVYGMLIAFIISLRLGNNIIERIKILKRATEAIASGNLDYKLSPDKISGFNMLDEAFNYMARSLKEHNDQLQRMHQQLARTEKLTAMGQMAAGVAHEINNPLGGILLYSSLVLEDLPENSPLRDNMQKIIYQANRCKDIVQGLLDFSRAPTGEMAPLQINQVVSTSLNLVKDQAMFHGIKIENRFADNLPEVMGDRSRLEEVFLNLFINAADAMNGKGKLNITTEMSKNDCVRISIADTGKGVSKDLLPHIFEPFFTTKEPGRGTGLGLSIVYGIIKRHKGTIDAESEEGKGTTFIVTLPAYRNNNDIKQKGHVVAEPKIG